MKKSTRVRRSLILVPSILALAGASFVGSAGAASGPNVLRVGTYKGIAGQFTSIQSAVDAARAGDWILVGPGDYHESPGRSEGVLITTPGIHLRGMNRNTVIVDGTNPGAAPCSRKAADQNLGPKGSDGVPGGRNGVVAFKADGVTLENFTACNFVTGPNGGEGNGIWFNGGDGSGQVGMGPYRGDYISATSTYSNNGANPRGQYGIFVSNAKGPGVIDHSYASNMGDSDYYIGACPDCNAILDHAHAQYSSLGYSGTNSGGHLIIQNSEFDHNKAGIVSNSQNNDDAPGPQNGLCPGGGVGPLGTPSCTVFRRNLVHSNNNPNVPGVGDGLAGASPVGTGIVLAGTEYITLSANHIYSNGSWGVLVVDLPDQEVPPPISNCEGGIYIVPGQLCYYQAFGNDTVGNHLRHNGFFGNPTNSDLALAALLHQPGNCFRNNTDPNGVTSDPPFIQGEPWATCGQPNSGDMGVLVAEAACASQILANCPNLPGSIYPRFVKVQTPPLQPQRTMPDPCAGVPANPWCPAASASIAASPSGHVVGGEVTWRSRRTVIR